MAPRSLIIATYALVAVSLWNPLAEPGASAIWELLRYGLFGLLAVFVLLHAMLRRGLVISRSPEWILLIAFLFYTALSALWSDGGLNAGLKGGLIITAMLVAISLANSLGLAVLLRIFYNTMTVFLMLSLLVVILLPERGVETGWLMEGDWKGIAGQKNGLGAVASLVLVATFALPLKTRDGGPPTFWSYCARLTVMAVAATCAVNSGSRGALVIAGVGLALILAARLPGAVQRVGVVVLIIVSIPLVLLAASTVQVRTDLIDVLGQTIDSNGRVTLWLYGLTQLGGRELLGFGVDGFWTPERVTAFRDLHGWVLDNFHNGYVTILVEGGALGLGLLLLMMAFLLLLYLVAIGNMRDGYVDLALAYAGMFFVGNFTENEIGRSTSLNFVMFLAISFSLRGRIEQVLGAASAGWREGDKDHISVSSPAPTLS